MQAQDHVAVVIPAFNEAEALPSFLAEIHASFESIGVSVSVIVVDDASTDATSDAAAPLADVIRSPRNQGHGPTALAAYEQGLRSGAGIIVHVDGDGQFYGDDIARVASALDHAEADVVHGVRRGRTDPWFRRALSGLVRFAVFLLCGRSVPDVNTPLRAYGQAALRRLVDGVSRRTPSSLTCISPSPKHANGCGCGTSPSPASPVAARSRRARCGVAGVRVPCCLPSSRAIRRPSAR